MNIHALNLGMKVEQVNSEYKSRPEGSLSKLRTITDGISILKLVIYLFVFLQPVKIFGAIFLILLAISSYNFFDVYFDFLDTGSVERMPTLIVSLFTGLTGVISLFTGLIIHSLQRARVERLNLAVKSDALKLN